MGPSKANEMLVSVLVYIFNCNSLTALQLMGRTFSAQEMVDCGFVSRILPSEGFRETVLDLAANAAKFSGEALKVTKDLIRDVDRDLLEQVNQREMAALGERMASSDSVESIMRFLGKTLCVSFDPI
jgi:peroxisomal 3,2-trans-enoyl-CoA isomerase